MEQWKLSYTSRKVKICKKKTCYKSFVLPRNEQPKKQRKTIEWERLKISSIKLDTMGTFHADGHNKGPKRSRRY